DCSSDVCSSDLDAATTMFHCWDCIGQVMSSAWFSPHIPLRINAKLFNLGFIRPENLVYHSLRPSFPVFHRGEASVWPLCHKTQICGVLCPAWSAVRPIDRCVSLQI